tara:strand:- start:1019 stop:1471 length:453 start_codon:yes stop_codon:yes gene_type:complete
MKNLLIIFFLIFVDLIVKKIIFETIYLNNFIRINDFFDLAHIHNYGISFGMFSGFISPWLIIILSLLITLFIIYIYFISNNILEKWSYLVIIAGALSNIIDRMVNGYVIDYIYLHYKEFYWPAFNFADIYITIGLCMLIFKFIKDLKKKI